jgi:hypothetical protein
MVRNADTRVDMLLLHSARRGESRVSTARVGFLAEPKAHVVGRFLLKKNLEGCAISCTLTCQFDERKIRA